MASQPEQTTTSQVPAGTNAGTDAPTRPLADTQAQPYVPKRRTGRIVNFATTAGGAAPGGTAGLPVTPPVTPPVAPPTIRPGAGAQDDSGQPQTTNTQQQTAAEQPKFEYVTPQPNILDQYPTYTWSASVYMLTPEQFKIFQSSPRQGISSYNLLFRSGGAARNSSEAQDTQFGPPAPGRNPFFSEDFYVDNIKLKTLTAGKGAGMAHSSAELSFTITEPGNISLIDRMYLAAQDLAPVSNGRVNYMSLVYLMVIRFYAQDSTGKIVQVGAKPGVEGGSDRFSLVEKYIPFQFTELSFTISNSLVTYNCTGTPLGHNMGLTIRKATIPFDIELTGATVDDVLNGPTVVTQSVSPDAVGVGSSNAAEIASQDQRERNRTASLAPVGINRAVGFATNAGGAATSVVRRGRFNNTTATTSPDRQQSQTPVAATPSTPASPPPKATTSVLTRGLVEAMNQQQQKLVQDGQRKYPDVYKIQYTPEAEAQIKNAAVQKPSSKVNKAATPAGTPVSQNTQSASSDKGQMVVTSRNLPITAGMQMVQAIELIVRNSEYITSQANIVFDEKSDQPKPNPKAAGQDKGIFWFNIIPSATLIPGQYDDKINDWAHEITYTISVYELRQFNSAFFPPPKFKGLHKQYFYWFTGQNTAVLDYKETHNTQYLLTVSGPSAKGTAAQKIKGEMTSSMLDMAFVMQSPRSNESGQGALNRSNELAANAAENIYSPTDLARTQLTIIGDPAWIMQGSLLGASDPTKIGNKPFNDDGSINFDIGEVLFEIAWQRPEDYNLGTGLADPYSRTQKIDGQRRALQSRIYQAVEIESEFRGGAFTQIVTGQLFTYPVKSGTTRAPDTAQPKSDAESDDQQDQREPDSSTTAGRPNAATPTQVEGAAGTNNGEDTPPPTAATGTGNQALNAAFMQNTQGGGAALRIPNEVNLATTRTSPESLALPTTANDTVQSAVPAAPVISNGVTVGAADTQLVTNQNTVTGQIQAGIVVGPVTVNGQVISPGDAGFADAANQLLRSNTKAQDLVNRLQQSRQLQDMAREP